MATKSFVANEQFTFYISRVVLGANCSKFVEKRKGGFMKKKLFVGLVVSFSSLLFFTVSAKAGSFENRMNSARTRIDLVDVMNDGTGTAVIKLVDKDGRPVADLTIDQNTGDLLKVSPVREKGDRPAVNSSVQEWQLIYDRRFRLPPMRVSPGKSLREILGNRSSVLLSEETTKIEPDKCELVFVDSSGQEPIYLIKKNGDLNPVKVPKSAWLFAPPTNSVFFLGSKTVQGKTVFFTVQKPNELKTENFVITTEVTVKKQ